MSTTRTQLPKDKLIETAAELIYRQGWNATGINQILGEAKVPKGSFYYYFHSKEDLGVAIVRYHAARLNDCYNRTLRQQAYSGKEAIEKFFQEQVEYQRQGSWLYGCPVGSFSSEVAATTEKIAAACREALHEHLHALAETIERGQRDGSIRADESAAKLAYFSASLWQGALLFMKSLKEANLLQNAISMIGARLFEATPAKHY